ncbi:hypothetical protein B0H16DRAFT_1269595, partial [Mycena metata]
GMPHQSIEADWCEGYYVLGVVCALSLLTGHSLLIILQFHGTDAEEFNPGRCLDEKGRLKPALADTKE